MKGKFPGCVLSVTLPVTAVDVNVHPAKTQVKFAREREVFDAVYHTVLDCLDAKGAPVAAPKAAEKPKEESTGNPDLDKMLKDGRLAIQEMKRLDDNIADPGISADIVRLEQVSQKIFDEVKRDPKKLPQIRRFMDYYLPTTLKLLNSYDRMSAAGVSGENIDSTLAKVEGMMDTITQAFDKQLDALFGAEAMDISTDITVMENLLAQEGLAGEGKKTTKSQGSDVTLEL